MATSGVDAPGPMESSCEEKPSHQSCTFPPMWKVIESGMGLKVPTYLKNLTRLRGFDTPIALAQMTGNHVMQMEHFGRVDMRKFIKNHQNPVDYYGIYHICPDSFEILSGHKILLHEVQRYVANQLAVDKFYFCRKMETSDRSEMEPPPIDEEIMDALLANQESPVNAVKATGSAKNHADISLKHEELYNKVKAWLGRQQEVSMEVIEKFTPFSVVVKLKGDTFIAKIVCPVCGTQYTAHYLQNGSRHKMRWIKANFERHVRGHYMVKKTPEPQLHDQTVYGTPYSAEETEMLTIKAENPLEEFD